MINAHLLPNLFLLLTGIYCFSVYFRTQYLYNRWLWVIYMSTLILPALMEASFLWKLAIPEVWKQGINGLRLTLGPVCLTVAVWGVIRIERVQLIWFMLTVIIGVGVFLALWWSGLQVLMPVVLAFLIIGIMTLGSFGLLQRRKSALWVIFSMMLLALSAKSGHLPIPIQNTGFHHYLEALSIFCLGKSAYFESSRLF